MDGKWFWRLSLTRNEWKMKDCREKMDVVVTGLEREREKNQ